MILKDLLRKKVTHGFSLIYRDPMKLYLISVSHVLLSMWLFRYLRIYSLSGYGDVLKLVESARKDNKKLEVLGVYLSRYMKNCAVERFVKETLHSGEDTDGGRYKRSGNVWKTNQFLQGFFRQSQCLRKANIRNEKAYSR